jgi:predicted NAD-dependent protein-ADP-ribosyltransferase YbiA (DUF1768 family)
MNVRLEDDLLVVIPESEAERAALAVWLEGRDDHVFGLVVQESGAGLHDDGLRAEVCREPINVMSKAPDPAIRLISNFAHTPFELDGCRYESVEGFWQGLKYPGEARRREVAELHGVEVRDAGRDADPDVQIVYRGTSVRVGTIDHWELMRIACGAKFSQHAAARAALLGTGDRPLMHRVRDDSRTIPGVVMADIWMRIRRDLR